MASNLGTPDGHGHTGQEFGQEFVWCVEHERAVSMCRRLAFTDYGRSAFDNCLWITEEEQKAEVAGSNHECVIQKGRG